MNPSSQPENRSARQFDAEIVIAAPKASVWKALTDAAELCRWFAPEARIDAQVGGEIVWNWGDLYHWPQRIEILEPGVRLRTRYDSSVADAAGKDLKQPLFVDFILADEGGSTTLRLCHSGFGADASFFLYLGSRLPAVARNADAVFPIGTFSEMDGTFTNFGRRVQRFHQALHPPGIARPAWMVLSRVLSASGEGEPASDAASAFDALSSGAPAFRGLSWTGLGLEGAVASGEPAVVGVAGNAEADD